MLVSDEERYIFFHVPKAGGTSIHSRLKERYGWTDDPPPVLHHMMVRDYLRFFPKKKDYFKFAIVRNPFDRLLSTWSDFTQNRLKGRIQNNYRMFLQNEGLWNDNILCVYRKYETNSDKFNSYQEFNSHHKQAYKWNVDDKSLEYFKILSEVDGGEFLTINKNWGFSDFCEQFIEAGWCNDIHFTPQHNILCDVGSYPNIIPDYIGKIETIKEDIKNISEKIGFNLTIGHDRKSSHNYYREMYSPKARRIIEEYFAVDLELFEYSY
jgi:hypothetical protein